MNVFQERNINSFDIRIKYKRDCKLLIYNTIIVFYFFLVNENSITNSYINTPKLSSNKCLKIRSPTKIQKINFDLLPILDLKQLTLMMGFSFYAYFPIFERFLIEFNETSQRIETGCQHFEIKENEEIKIENKPEIQNYSRNAIALSTISKTPIHKNYFSLNKTSIGNSLIDLLLLAEQKINDTINKNNLENNEIDELTRRLEEINTLNNCNVRESFIKEPTLSDFNYINSLEEDTTFTKKEDNYLMLKEEAKEKGKEELSNQKGDDKSDLPFSKGNAKEERKFEEENNKLKMEVQALQEKLRVSNKIIRIFRNQIDNKIRKRSF